MKNNITVVAVLSLLLGSTIGLVVGYAIGFNSGFNSASQMHKDIQAIQDTIESAED